MTKTKITKAELIQTCRQLGLRASKQDGEYRIRIPGKPECDYFTTDIADALGTAHHMWAAERWLSGAVGAAGAACDCVGCRAQRQGRAA